MADREDVCDLQDRIDLADELHADGQGALGDGATELVSSCEYLVWVGEGWKAHLEVIRYIVVFAARLLRRLGGGLIRRRGLGVAGLVEGVPLGGGLVSCVGSHAARMEVARRVLERIG